MHTECPDISVMGLDVQYVWRVRSRSVPVTFGTYHFGSKTYSRGAVSGPRAPPLGLNPMHILLYPP